MGLHTIRKYLDAPAQKALLRDSAQQAGSLQDHHRGMAW
jgi:hypothetical protein